MSYSSKTLKSMFANISTAVITYIELKDVASLTKPSYINQWISNDDNMKNKIYAENIDIIMSLLLNGANGGSDNELMSFLKINFRLFNNIELHLENAVYIQNLIKLTANFSSICIDNFNCSILKIDFRNKVHAAETINNCTKNNFILLPSEEMEPGNLKYLKKNFNFAQLKFFRHTYSLRNNTIFEDNADFTHFSEIPLKVNNIVQKISTKINKGILDASYVIKKNIIRKPIGLPWELVVDRPFLYIIKVDNRMMFSGILQTPDFLIMKDEL
ncbi:hypothetical protein ACFW04_001254 [Cataglyphis niger]